MWSTKSTVAPEATPNKNAGLRKMSPVSSSFLLNQFFLTSDSCVESRALIAFFSAASSCFTFSAASLFARIPRLANSLRS